MKQINLSSAMHEVLYRAVKYAISRNANIWSEKGLDDDEGVTLEDAKTFLEENGAPGQ